MKYLTYAQPEQPYQPHLGVLLGEDVVVDLTAAAAWGYQVRHLPQEDLPESLFELIHAGPAAWEIARNQVNILEGEDPLRLQIDGERPVAYPLGQVFLYPPLPRPTSIRDFYAFEKHVSTAFANRGREVPAEWYQFPAFYYSNPNAVFGPNEVVPYPGYTNELDYELEVACVVGTVEMDIPAEKAAEAIFGYTIMNDWSARDEQRLEMRVGLGPAKGKDFATSLGPWVVTPDELADRSTGRAGVYDLAMTARVNGEVRSQGNWKDLYFSFGEMIARASESAFLLPGDVIGSGTVGTGCLLELTRGQGPWLKPGDTVEMEVERLGKLVNRVQTGKGEG